MITHLWCLKIVVYHKPRAAHGASDLRTFGA